MNKSETQTNEFNKEMTKELNDKEDFIKATSLILQVFLGGVLLIKAVDGAFTLFPVESYQAEAKALLTALEGTTLLAFIITGVHVLLGTFLIFNLWVPFTLMMAAPLALFAFSFEAMYGTLGLPQVLTGMALISSIILMVYHWGFFKNFFRAQSTYDMVTPQSAKAELLLLEEVRERAPRKYQKIVSMEEIQESII